MNAGASSWTRELVELAALFLAVAAADLFANSVAHVSGGVVVLSALAVLLLVCAVVHHRVRHRVRRQVRQRPSAPPASPTGTWRVRATVRDTPGSLAELAAGLASRRVNILSVQVHPVPGGVVDEFLVESRSAGDEITAAVGLGTLLGDCDLRWDPDGTPTEGPDGTVMRLRDPEGGLLTVSRAGVAFTPAEYARVHALLALDEEFARWLRAQHSVLLLPGGEELTIRPAAVDDVPALTAMHHRCSRRTRRQRYLSSGTRPGPADLTRMVNRRHGRTLVVTVPGGAVVAMGNLMHDGGDAEVALLVEDAWQRRGIGTVLMRRLLAAVPEGRTATAVTEDGNAGMLAVLRGVGAEVNHGEMGVAHATLPAR
jgi:GNAT superfamily N-acetyltransferase